MKKTSLKFTLGIVCGALLGIGVMLFGTNGNSGESDTEKHSHQKFFWFEIFDERGAPEDVRQIERKWEQRLFGWSATIGGLAGAIVVYLSSRPKQ